MVSIWFSVQEPFGQCEGHCTGDPDCALGLVCYEHDSPNSARFLGTDVTGQPTLSDKPSDQPSLVPSNAPSDQPSLIPSDKPSDLPSLVPSDKPSDLPSLVPSDKPSDLPSLVPSDKPSDLPSLVPSEEPSVSSIPSKEVRKQISFFFLHLL